MTREEAVRELIAMKPHIESAMSIVGADAYDMAIEALEQPEIIRCKDCKYFEQYTDDGTFESVLKMHQWDGECSEWVGHTYMDRFCSRAKRRTE